MFEIVVKPIMAEGSKKAGIKKINEVDDLTTAENLVSKYKHLFGSTWNVWIRLGIRTRKFKGK
jgi:hypothetical protein